MECVICFTISGRLVKETKIRVRKLHPLHFCLGDFDYKSYTTHFNQLIESDQKDMLLSLRGRRKASQPSFHNVIYVVTYIMIPLTDFFKAFINQSFYKKNYEKLKQR